MLQKTVQSAIVDTQDQDRLKNLSRKIKMSYDDRTVFPRLKFEQFSKLIKLEICKDDRGSIEPIHEQVVDVSEEIKRAPFLTRLAPSSVIEKCGSGDIGYFK